MPTAQSRACLRRGVPEDLEPLAGPPAPVGGRQGSPANPLGGQTPSVRRPRVWLPELEKQQHLPPGPGVLDRRGQDTGDGCHPGGLSVQSPHQGEPAGIRWGRRPSLGEQWIKLGQPGGEARCACAGRGQGQGSAGASGDVERAQAGVRSCSLCKLGGKKNH